MNRTLLFRCFEGYIFLAVCVFWCEGIPQLYFTSEPSNATGHPGSSVLLPCAASGLLQPITITWRQCGNWIQNRSGLTEVQTDGSLLLHLTDALLQSGLLDDPFRCCSSNAIGTLCTPPVVVELTDPPSKPQVVVLPQESGVIVNGSLRLLCQSQASQSHPIQWLKDGRSLEETIRHTLLPGGVLQIAPVTGDDEGEYQCATGNPVTPLTTSRAVHVSVVQAAGNSTASPALESSAILAGPKKTEVNLPAEKVVLECLAAGSWVDVQWSRSDGQPLPSGSQFIGHKNLELSLTTQDIGRSGYTCQANDTRSGLISRESAIVEVTDYRLPQFTEVPKSGFFPYLVNGRLLCTASGNPAPDISWYLNGEQIWSSDGSTDGLFLWNMDEHLEGIYQCVASNALGSVHASAYIRVKVPAYPPEPPSNPTTRTVDSRSISVSWHAPEQISSFSVHYCKEPLYATQQTSRGACESSARCCMGPGVVEDHNFLPEYFSRSFSVTGLSPFSNYTFFMRSFMYNYTPSAVSECVHGQTAEGVPITAPTFSLSGITAYSILVLWDHVTDLTQTRGYVTTYRICFRETLLKDDSFSCRQVNSSVTSFTIQGLKASTDYDILMAVSTSTGYGPDSDVQSVQTTEVGNCSVPPIYPLDEASVLNNTKLELAWSDLGADVPVIPVSGFNLAVSTVTNDEGIDLPASARSYVVSNLLPRSRHTITLRAYNGCGMGQAYVQTVTMPTITAKGSSFPPPDNITATALSSTSMKLIWDPVQFSISSYYQVVYRANASQSEDNNLEAFRVDNYVVLEDLMPYTTYVLQVRVLQQSGSIGQYSANIFCTTEEDVPSAPMNLSAKPLNPHTISVSWNPPLNPNGIIQAYRIVYAQEEDRQEGATWNTTRMNGTENSSTIKNLISNSTYYFALRASTSAGEGTPSTVRVRTPQETSYEVKVGPTGKGGQPTDAEKGIFIGIMLGSICILLCTMMAAMKYKRMKAVHKLKMASRLPGSHARVPVSHLAHGSKNIEMEMTAISPMLALGVPQDQTPRANGQIACESPLLCPGHCPDNRDVPRDSSEDDVELPGPLTGNSRQDQQQQHAQYRHTLPYMTDGQATNLVKGCYASPKCSASLPESGSEDGADTSSRWTPLRESTSGDSGMVGDMELSGEDTSPDFIEKVLREFGVVASSTKTGHV